MKVHINGRGHEVTVETENTDLSYVIDKAQKLWNETKPTTNQVGFDTKDRDGQVRDTFGLSKA
jgi:hypothetical protein